MVLKSNKFLFQTSVFKLDCFSNVNYLANIDHKNPEVN